MAVVWAWMFVRLDVAVARARVIADDPAQFDARLTRASGWPLHLARMLPRADRHELAGTLAALAERTSDDPAARLMGIASFLAGRGADASRSFAAIRDKTKADWNDLAAAQIVSDDLGEERWLAALVAADRAAGLEESRFNRAAVLDHFGVTHVDASSWPQSEKSAWGARAATRAAIAAAAAAPRTTKTIADAALEDLPDLAHRYPEDARSVAAGLCLTRWARAKTPGEAELHLRRARIISTIVLREIGDTFVEDVLADLDQAGTRIDLMRAGLIAYEAGREALKDDPGLAARHLAESRNHLSAAGSRMALVAAAYLGTAQVKQGNLTEALALLAGLRAEVRRHAGYKALLARIQHDIALCEAQLGRWSSSNEAATESLRLATSMRDRFNASATEAVVADNYDYLGQQALVWKHAVHALRDACITRQLVHARGTLSTLTRAQMRAGQWAVARSVARVESEFRRVAPSTRTDVGLFIRIAIIEAHVRDDAEATRAFANARQAAARTAPATVRAKLLADIDGAEGSILRKRNPRRAVQLLNSAIAYQHNASRALLLPELYLERGRAHLMLEDRDAAERDFDLGIAELERQRDHVDDAAVRPGLFDSSAALFHEAVALQVRRRAAPTRVLRTIERGRARAMLEQMGESRVPPSLAQLQRELRDGELVVEYFVLEDQVVIVAITRSDARVVSVAIPREDLANADRARLYDVLVRPVLRGERALTFVADDALQRVPFSALLDRTTNELLIERHIVATAPSAGVALIAMQNEQRGKPASALVFANPAIPRDKYPNLPSLTASHHEAASVARRYEDAKVLQGEEATAEHFLELAPQYEVVHFAGHAEIAHAEPGASALVCASSPNLHGGLTLRQIAAMRFEKTRVVVLAACSTMTGRNAAIEGVPSLARGFVVAGVPAVIGTLRDIDDREAVSIMRVLHDELAKGASPAEALRTAQLAAIREGTPVEPWSAFAVTGVAR